MIFESFYLSDQKFIEKALKLTGLSFDELEQVTGRFKKNHWKWPNQLKGEIVVSVCGKVKIRHHFNKKTIWSE